MIPDNFSFTLDGHSYTVTRVENSTRYTVVRDNRYVRNVTKEELGRPYTQRTIAKLFENGHVDVEEGGKQ